MSALLSFLLYTLLTWLIIHLLHSTIPFLQKSLTLQTFHITYNTEKFNNIFFKIGQKYSNFLKLWFNLGIATGILSMLVGWLGIWLISWRLLVTLVNKLSAHFINNLTVSEYSMLALNNNTSNGGGDNSAVIVPLIPGVNLPLNELPILFLVLLISGIWHEMGHGIAGGRERIPILSSGVFLSLIYPGAYIELNQLILDNQLYINQLRVILAGIWHNLTLSTLSYLIIWLNLDFLGFRASFWKIPMGEGIGVININNNNNHSASFDNLPNLSSIIKLNNNQLNYSNLSTWNDLLLTENSKFRNSTTGYCIKLDTILDSTESCCHPPYTPMSTPSTCYYSVSPQLYNIRGCLPISTLLDDNIKSCNSQLDCNNSGGDSDDEEVCLIMSNYPSNHPHHFTHLKFLPYDNNLEGEAKDFLFVGNPKQIYESVKVSQLLPRSRLIPSSIPTWTRQFLAYLTSLNLALLFLNGLPAFKLDGYHALKTLLKLKFLKFQIRSNNNNEEGEREREGDDEENLPYFNNLVGITNLLLVWCMLVSTLCILI